MRISYVLVNRPARGRIITRIELVGLPPGMLRPGCQVNKDLVVAGHSFTSLPVQHHWNRTSRLDGIIRDIETDQINATFYILVNCVRCRFCDQSCTSRLCDSEASSNHGNQESCGNSEGNRF